MTEAQFTSSVTAIEFASPAPFEFLSQTSPGATFTTEVTSARGPQGPAGDGSGGEFRKVSAPLVPAVDGATLTADDRVVLIPDGVAELTLPPGPDVGAGQGILFNHVGDTPTVIGTTDAGIGGQPTLTLYPGDVVALVTIDLSPLGIPAWQWGPESLYGASWNLPVWRGDNVTEDVWLGRAGGGAPGWAPFPTADIDLGTVYNVRDFGAVGSTDSDDTEAFEAACAAAALLPGVILVPSVDVAAGERYLVRRRITVPSWSTLRGEGQASYIAKPDTFGSTAPSVYLAGATTFLVNDASGFAVGDEITINEPVGNFEWNSTHAVIESIDGNEVTIDRPSISAYSSPYVHSLFPLVTNHATPDNDAAPPTRAIRVEHLALDQNHGAYDPQDVTEVDFTNSVVHWEHGFDCVVHDVHIVNAAGDAYSDQYRGPDSTPGYGYPTSNAIIGSHVHNGVRHGVHIGSDTASAQVVGNRITDCGYMGVFLCRNAQNTAITGNTFVNCRQGIGGSDVRQADDEAVTDSTPYGDIRGDIGTAVNGNTFLGGPLSDVAGALPAVTLGAQGEAVGNTIMDWNGGILVVTDAVDCSVTGNTITLAPNYSGGSGVAVSAGAHRCTIMGNTVRGGGHGSAVIAKQDTGVAVESADDVTILGNTFANLSHLTFLSGAISNLTWAHNTAVDVADSYGLVRVFGALTDATFDVMSLDLAANSSPELISYHDGEGAAAQVRLVVNGVGNNGTDDPALAGQWSTITDPRFRGVRVEWDDSGTPRVSHRTEDDQWVALGAGTPAVDRTEWHRIYDEVRATAGLFGDSGTVYTDQDLTEYDEIRVRLVGRGASTSFASCAVRMRFNGDVGNNYLLNTNGTATSAWNNNGSMPTLQTNTNRRGMWEAVIALGHTDNWTIAEFENVYVTSTATAGSARVTGSLYYTNLAAAIASFELYDSLGNGWAAGTRLTVWGRKLPA